MRRGPGRRRRIRWRWSPRSRCRPHPGRPRAEGKLPQNGVQSGGGPVPPRRRQAGARARSLADQLAISHQPGPAVRAAHVQAKDPGHRAGVIESSGRSRSCRCHTVRVIRLASRHVRHGSGACESAISSELNRPLGSCTTRPATMVATRVRSSSNTTMSASYPGRDGPCAAPPGPGPGGATWLAAQ